MVKCICDVADAALSAEAASLGSTLAQEMLDRGALDLLSPTNP